MNDFLHYQLQGTIRETLNLFKKGTCSFGTKTSGFCFGWIRHNTSAIRENMFFMHFMIVLMTILIIVIMTTTLSRILYRFRWKLRYMYYVANEKYKGEANHIDLGVKCHFILMLLFHTQTKTETMLLIL